MYQYTLKEQKFLEKGESCAAAVMTFSERYFASSSDPATRPAGKKFSPEALRLIYPIRLKMAQSF